MSARCLLLAALVLAAAAPAGAQQPRRPAAEARSLDFAGLWAAQPGGRAGVEIRVSGHAVEARELFNPGQPAAGQCGTLGTGRADGRTARISFRGRCQDGRTTSATLCTVQLETRDRIRSTCRNGHRTVLYRVGR